MNQEDGKSEDGHVISCGACRQSYLLICSMFKTERELFWFLIRGESLFLHLRQLPLDFASEKQPIIN